ncbi:LacI family DNA-binding transcriptional regulator [Runella slithyformis]|uniref:Transcriptional regulator, LacI family n=1 Tax=Runella slithyformis (strain ATCC 29530 / DSM 19594 / LMG 11500 / NCIMB 11436 / LSU 4) TaxID=761193 RepID=A0A7U4E5X9_RUNSL|nr:substrate-binding domain-containing protein [Runella slithyformis]AEI49031.1 transcriptional regulator, LacI family [Runella slithyformis DSM 19594]
MKKHQITIVDIARQLNISKSTVSRALTGHPRVSEKTKEAVLKLAGELDYQRNMLAINLMSSQSHTIGIIVPEFVTSFFPMVIMGAQEVASKAGYNVLISQSNESYETEVANAKVMLDNRVDGVLVSLTRETRNYDHLNVFQRKGIPIVFFNRVCDDMQVPKVVVDDYEGAFKAVEHLILTGRKRIAHLGGPTSLHVSKKRLEGYKDALRKYSQPIDQELILDYDLNLDKVKIYIKHLLDLPQPPDALFTINDPTAFEAMLFMKAKGIKIPEQIAVVGFSNNYGSTLIEPRLTTVAQPTHEIGQVAAQLLLDQINSDASEWKPIYRVLKTELLVRGSS